MGRSSVSFPRGESSEGEERKPKASAKTGKRGKREAKVKSTNVEASNNIKAVLPVSVEVVPVEQAVIPVGAQEEPRQEKPPTAEKAAEKILSPVFKNEKLAPDTETARIGDLGEILKEEKPTYRQLRRIYETHQKEGGVFFSDENKIKQALTELKEKAARDLADDRRDIMKRFEQLVVREKGEEKREKKPIINLDSRACLFFFRKILGFERPDSTQEEKDFLARTQYIKLGEDEKMNRGLFLNMSPGVQGSQVRGEGKGYADHHGPKSPRHSSAFQELFNEYYNGGLLDYLNDDERLVFSQMAEFISHIDGYTLPEGENWETAWKRSDWTLFGVTLLNQDEASIDDLYECFKAQPYNQEAAFQRDITASDKPFLSSFKDLAKKGAENKKQAENFLKKVDAEREKLKIQADAPRYSLIESPTLGKIVIHFQQGPEKRMPALQFAALGHNYDGALNWQPHSHTFLLSVRPGKEITKEMAEKIPGVVLVRGSMLLSSKRGNKKIEKEIKLADLLQAIGVNVTNLKTGGWLRDALEEKKKEKPKPAPVPAEAAAGPEVEVSKIASPSTETPPAPSTPETPVTPTTSETPPPSTETAVPAGPETSSTPATVEAPRAVETTQVQGEPELKQAMDEAKTALEATKKNWEKYQGILGLFRRGKTEEKAQIKEEYKAAKERYALAKAEYVFFKADNYLKHDDEMVKGYANVIARTLERKRGGTAREWLEKIGAVWKALGDLNIARAFKFEDKLAKWQPESEIGKIGKVLANLGGRFLSVRTAISLGLLGGAVWAGSGVTFAALMLSRRTLVGLGGFFGTNDAWKGIERTKFLKEIPKDKLSRLSNEELIERMRQIEVYNLLEGKEDFSGFGYNQLKTELAERIENERIIPAPAETPVAAESSAERETGERGQAVEKKLESLLANVDKQLAGLVGAKKKLEKSQIKRLATSAAVGGLLGSGLFGEIIGRTWHGLFGSESGMGEPIEALTKKSIKAMEVCQQKISLFAKIAVTQDTQIGRTANVLSTLQEFQNKSLTALHESLEKIHLTEISNVHKGEGVWHAVHRQLADQLYQHPDKFGLKPEDLADADKVKAVLDHKTGELLIQQKFIRPDGSEIRIAKPGVKVLLEPDNKINVEGEGKTTYEWKPKLVWEENWKGRQVVGPEYWQGKLEKFIIKHPEYGQGDWPMPQKGASLEEVQQAYEGVYQNVEKNNLPWPEELLGTKPAAEALTQPKSPSASLAEHPSAGKAIPTEPTKPAGQAPVAEKAQTAFEQLDKTEELAKHYINQKLPLNNRLSALKEMLPAEGKLKYQEVLYWPKGYEVWYKVPGAPEGPVDIKSIGPLTKWHQLASQPSATTDEIEKALKDLRKLRE